MLTLFPAAQVSPEAIKASVWIDLIDPTPEEIAAVETALDCEIPTKAALSEIETSSRLQVEGDTLRVSAPILAHADTPRQELTPVGFIVSPRHLVTVRFDALRAFEQVGARPAATSMGVFVQLLEAIVDRGADLLEMVASDLETLSRRLFRTDPSADRNLARNNAILRQTLMELGQLGHRLATLRGMLLGVGRIVPFISEVCGDLANDHHHRLNAVRQDVVSLDDFENHLSNKIQFLLDATLGFINTEQNELFKVLTIVSVVGVPPTLVASIYGMNFHKMPELNWTLGYPYALVLIVASAVLPILWFKWRRWW